MPGLQDVLQDVDTLTFDCYGTLIDWESGIRTVMAELAGLSCGRLDAAELFDAYLAIEAELESGPYLPYWEILTRAQVALVERNGLTLPPAARTRLASSVPDWPPFPDTVAALQRLAERFRLGILSNIDRDLFAATSRHLGVQFEFVITAEDVQSYKPAHAHFRQATERIGRLGAHLHVAQSLYHDGVPARDLNLPFVWINRRGEQNATPAVPLAEFPTLAAFAAAT